MWGIEGRDLEPIHSVAKQFDPNYNPEKLGAWGILFFCCGAMAVRNSLWRNRVSNSDIFIRPSDISTFVQGSDICTSDDYAVRFSEFIKKWSNDSVANTVIEKRLASSRDKMNDKTYLYKKKYLVLAFMLNSLHDLSRENLLGFNCRTWVSVSNAEERNYGWPELFFAAGIFLNNEESVDWRIMAYIIHLMGKSINIDVTALYEHYAGQNPFLEPKAMRIRTDQLKKGARVRMRNGWEAIVVKGCEGNALIAKVFGDFTETGSVYAHDIVAAEVDGKWVEVEMTEEQSRFYAELKEVFGETGSL